METFVCVVMSVTETSCVTVKASPLGSVPSPPALGGSFATKRGGVSTGDGLPMNGSRFNRTLRVAASRLVTGPTLTLPDEAAMAAASEIRF